MLLSVTVLAQDKDLIAVVLTQFDSDRLALMVMMTLPEDHCLGGMGAANAWNTENTSHGTLAYVSKLKEKLLAILESHLNLKGRVTRENIPAWVDNFILSINPFETKLREVLPTLEPDSKMGKSGGGFWRTLGAIGEGFLEVALTPTDSEAA